MSDLPSVGSIDRMSQKELQQTVDGPRGIPQQMSHVGKEVLIWPHGLTRETSLPARIVRSDLYPSWQGLEHLEDVLFFQVLVAGTIVSSIEYSWAFR